MTEQDRIKKSAEYLRLYGLHVDKDDPQLIMLCEYDRIFTQQIGVLKSKKIKVLSIAVFSISIILISISIIGFVLYSNMKKSTEFITYYADFISKKNVHIQKIETPTGSKIMHSIVLRPSSVDSAKIGDNIILGIDGTYYVPLKIENINHY